MTSLLPMHYKPHHSKLPASERCERFRAMTLACLKVLLATKMWCGTSPVALILYFCSIIHHESR
ncbi:hypothetical protein GALMADRAFT_869162 [Galerina marginata CBS 339.88]|uniref:Uncharacterized protein n=1 Tax=Galerina marginata (strain CBS 339.88) TaxID=685588 RepID=A0A067TVQ8_GALM3|nr:hypothetical protein GALMADRAFT_869162 [Galerina marginata CBS 339.88]